MSLENMSLSDGGSEVSPSHSWHIMTCGLIYCSQVESLEATDEILTTDSDDVPLQRKRKKGSRQSHAAGKRRRLTSVSSASYTSANDLLPSAPGDGVVQRQPGVTVEVSPPGSEMSIYDFPSSPLRPCSSLITRDTVRSVSPAFPCGRASIELGSGYTPPESGQREAMPFGSQLYTQSPPLASNQGEVTLQLATSELSRLSGAVSKKSTRGKKRAVSELPGGTEDDPMCIKSESESETLEAAVANAKVKAKKLAKREKKREQETESVEQWAGFANATDSAQVGSGTSPCPLSTTHSQIPSSSLAADTAHGAPSVPDATSPRRKKKQPKFKREKSATIGPQTPLSSNERQDAPVTQEGSKKQKSSDKKRQIPTPPKSASSNATDSAQSSQSSRRPPAGPKSWVQPRLNVQAALDHDRQVRMSAPTPPSMSRQIGVTDQNTGCGDDALDLAIDQPPSLAETGSPPEPMLTTRCRRDQIQCQEAKKLSNERRGRPEMKYYRQGKPIRLQSSHSTQGRNHAKHTEHIPSTNALRNEVMLRERPPASLPLARRLITHEEGFPYRPSSSLNSLEPRRHRVMPSTSVPNFNQRQKTMPEHFSLPNPGRRNWLPLPSLRQQTPAEWHTLGRTSANSTVPGPIRSDPESDAVKKNLVRKDPVKLSGSSVLKTTASKNADLRPSQPNSQYPSQPTAQRPIIKSSTSQWHDPSWSHHSRSPSGESSYLLWGSIRMKTTWEADEKTVMESFSDGDGSDGLEIVDVPRPRRWGL